ncbi:RNA 2'-phosphotransferase [Paenibacillus soyae]|uniref:Probable RNA 2'-phosphotransferase n=1 Tax=Paenibacillus soyae TaxID=2969249 RepID=A0A9X2S767_9BACL|nr:RNA 2'-phosphotransferase [Paenibacillus soyae]MCR2802730.1 RNA 2'-phosphotransferase [Paenibacillus soyae]
MQIKERGKAILQKPDYAKLSKEVSYALRHAPWVYELELDAEGWVAVGQLVHSLRTDRQWTLLTAEDVSAMAELSSKKRFEIQDGKIRALYGHSIPEKIVKKAEMPPNVVFHGTAGQLVKEILKSGLKPMARQYVHLSADRETALVVGKRKDPVPVLLCIDSRRAWQEGILFYRGNETVWLSDHVPSSYISLAE